jgi:hypothetical protein
VASRRLKPTALGKAARVEFLSNLRDYPSRGQSQRSALGTLIPARLRLHTGSRRLRVPSPLVPKLQLGNALVFEAQLRRRGSRLSAPVRCRRGEAELPRQVRDQAGAWSRGSESGGSSLPHGLYQIRPPPKKFPVTPAPAVLLSHVVIINLPLYLGTTDCTDDTDFKALGTRVQLTRRVSGQGNDHHPELSESVSSV